MRLEHANRRGRFCQLLRPHADHHDNGGADHHNNDNARADDHHDGLCRMRLHLG
jgi:hypothetical protein